MITFKCVYKNTEGKLHTVYEDIVTNNTLGTPVKGKKEVGLGETEIRMKYLLSMKFFFKSKIVGIECRTKSEKGTEHIQIGNCSSNVRMMLFSWSISC